MNKIVNKNDLNSAHRTKREVAPAIIALKNIDAQSVGHDPRSLEKIAAFVIWLQEYKSKSDAVINQAQSQLENKPETLIKAAGLRLFAIPGAINREHKAVQNQIDTYQLKLKELREKGFTKAEIDALVAHPQPEIDAHKSAIEELEVEQKKIEKFLGDSPRFDTTLLNDAKLAPYLQHQPTGE